MGSPGPGFGPGSVRGYWGSGFGGGDMGGPGGSYPGGAAALGLGGGQSAGGVGPGGSGFGGAPGGVRGVGVARVGPGTGSASTLERHLALQGLLGQNKAVQERRPASQTNLHHSAAAFSRGCVSPDANAVKRSESRVVIAGCALIQAAATVMAVVQSVDNSKFWSKAIGRGAGLAMLLLSMFVMFKVDISGTRHPIALDVMDAGA